MNDELDKTLDFVNPDSPYPTFAHEVASALGLDTASPTLKEDIRRKLTENEKLGIRECTLEIDDEDEEILDRVWGDLRP